MKCDFVRHKAAEEAVKPLDLHHSREAGAVVQTAARCSALQLHSIAESQIPHPQPSPSTNEKPFVIRI